MSFQKGKMSLNFCTTAPLTKEQADTFKITATLAMRRYTFRPVDEKRGECQSYGWCNLRKPLEKTFFLEDVFIEPYLHIGFRIDKKTICPLLFKATVQKKVDEECTRQKLSKISRQQRLAIEEDILHQMLSGVTAQTGFHEVVWNIETGHIYISAPPGITFDTIIETFELTFGIHCFRITPENLFRAKHDAFTQPPPFYAESILTYFYSNQFPENDKSLNIVYGEDMTFINSQKEKAAIKGNSGTGLEEKLLNNHYLIQKAAMKLRCHEDEWQFNLNAEKFHFSALRTPAPPVQDEEENFKYRMQSVAQLFELLNIIIAAYRMKNESLEEELMPA